MDMSREAAKKRNAKAFGVNSAVAMRKKFNHSQDIKNLKEYIPVVKNQTDEPPPLIVALVGPPKVGKSTLIRSLIKVIGKNSTETHNFLALHKAEAKLRRWSYYSGFWKA